MSQDQKMGVTDFERAAVQLETVPPSILELLDRQATAFLHAVWRARNIEKRVIDEEEYQHLRRLCNDENVRNGNGFDTA